MEYASFWRRGAAALIDAIIITALSGLCARLIPLFPLSFVLHFFYKPIFESSRVRATPGKYLAEISVERSNGDQMSLKDAYIRYFSSWISGLTLGIGYLMALFTKKNQTLHDIFADTVVVNKVYENDGLWNEWLAQMKVLFKRNPKNT
ncbi:MAG: RDD family protein [Bacteriovorax sp.]